MTNPSPLPANEREYGERTGDEIREDILLELRSRELRLNRQLRDLTHRRDQLKGQKNAETALIDTLVGTVAEDLADVRERLQAVEAIVAKQS